MTKRLPACARISSDSGSALVDFLLVIPLVISAFIAVGELTMLSERRSVLASAIAQGVREASVADGSLSSGVARSRAVLVDHEVPIDDVQLNFVRSTVNGIHYVVGSGRWPIKVIGITVELKEQSRSIDESAL